LELDPSKINRGLSTAVRSLKNFSKNAAKATLSAAKYGAGLSAVAATISTVFVRKQLDMIDALAKTADGLGITTEKLQALQHVGQLTGSTSEEINKSLPRMERRLGEVARIGGAGAVALADLGISIDDIIKQTPDKQLETLSAALVGVENQAVKASIANDIFGRSGLKMLKLMEELKDKGLSPAVKELDQLGFAINRIDAAKVEAANDSMLRFNKAIEGVFKRLTVQLAPILEGISNEFLVWIKNSGGADKVMADMVDSMVTGFGFVADAVTVVVRIVKSVVGAVMAVFNAVSSGFNKLKGFVGQFVTVTAEGEKFIDKLGSKVPNIFGDLPSKKIKKFAEDVKVSSQKAAEAVAQGVESTKRTGDFTATFFEEKAAASAKSMSNELETFRTGLLTEREEEIQHYEKRLAALDNFLATKRITEEEAAQARLTIEQQHQQALTDLTRASEQERSSLIQSALQGQISNVASAAKLITGSIGKESKKQFEISKVASIASALVKGYESVTSSFAAGSKIGGPAVGFAFAATAAAATAAQISQIKAQQFNGGGSVSSPSGGSSGAVAGQAASGAEQQRSFRIETVDPNSTITGEALNGLIEQINGAVSDGATLISSGVQS
jgi:hypothetical protein